MIAILAAPASVAAQASADGAEAQPAPAQQAAQAQPAQPVSEAGQARAQKRAQLQVELAPSDWHAIAGAPVEALVSARVYVRDKDHARAQTDLRRASLFVRLEAGRAEGATRSSLLEVARDLERLADEVAGGKIGTIERLDPRLADAALALAVHHYRVATDRWALQQREAAGHELRAAGFHLDHALIWSSAELSAATRALVSDSLRVGDRLVGRFAVADDEVGRVIRDLGQELDVRGRTEPQAAPVPEALPPPERIPTLATPR